MRSFLTALLLAAGITPAALADAPKASIKGPLGADAGATIVLDARGSASDRPLRWKLDGPDVPFLVLDQDGRKGVIALLPTAPPGTYKFTLIAKGIPAGETELDADAAILVVVVGPPPEPTPTPTPLPRPKPTPPAPPVPAPVSGALHATLVVDLDAMTPETAVLREGLAVRPAFQAIDAHYHTLAARSPELATYGLGPVVAQAGGAPALIIQDATGKVLSATQAPASEADLIDSVKRFRGTTK